MKSLKKINLIIASVLLVLTGIFFIGCGKTDYSSISLTCDEAEVTMDIGETRTINFKIENFASGMSGRLALSVLNNSGCISYEVSDPRNGVTSVNLEAKAGGTTSLRAVTLEGNKECVVTVNVRAYSQSLNPSDERLFVSNSTAFTPSSSHFIFDANTTEKTLKYNFFGTVAPGISGEKLTLDSVREGEGFINEFVSVRMVSVENDNFLVFRNNEGAEFTLRDLVPTTAQNQRYQFIALTKNEAGEYDFSDAFKVSIGNKFSFVARYSDEIFAQRDFYVMPDIVTEPITWQYSFQHGDGFWAPEDSGDLDTLIIVPNRQRQSISTNVIDYSKAKLEVAIPNTGDNVKMKYSVDNPDILNVDRVNAETNGSVFEFAVSGKTSVGGATNIRINIYYDGFENSKDKSVNYEYVIPVEIKFEPKTLTVSGNILEKATFYNNYSGLNYGWQDFYLFVSPDTCTYEELKVIYNPNEVMLRYNNIPYSKGDGTYLVDEANPDGNRYIIITDISKPVQIKGVNGAEQVESGRVYFQLSHNVLGIPSDEQTIVEEVEYQIKAGATSLDFIEDAEAYKRSGVYFALDGGETLFNLLQANADFTNIEFTYRPTGEDSVDVVNLIYRRADASTNGIANIWVTPKAIGSGTYVIRLDNGLATEVTFRVIETLQSVTIAGGSDTSAITRLSTNAAENEGGSDAEIFILSERDGDKLLSTNASIELFANGSRNSTAMLVDRVDENVSGNGFTYTYSARSLNSQNKFPGAYLDIRFATAGDGNGVINFNIRGYRIDNFQREEFVITYKINVVSYSLISKLNVLKTMDGNGSYLEEGESRTPANYVYVYKMTSNVEPRTARFSIAPRYTGYLFRNPVTNALQREAFFDGSGLTSGARAKFVYWTIPGNDILVSNSAGIATRMVYDPRYENTYTIGNYGIFDTEQMSFTAFQEAEDFTFDIIAHVEQADGRTFSFPINIQALNYAEVRGLTVQPNVVNNELNFSLAESGRKKDLIIYTSPANSTNSTVVVQFTPATIQGKDEEGQTINIPVNLFGQYNSADNSYEGLTLKQVDASSWLLSLDVTKFIENNLEIANNSTQSLSGTLVIAAADWLDASGNVKNNYLSSVKRFTVNFANGSLENPFYLETPQDVLNIKDGLNAHYRLSTSIDMSNCRNQLPLGRFSGSIVGTNDYAKISGLVLNNSVEGQTSYGLFTEVVRQKLKDQNGQDTAEDDLRTGLIENVEFEGSLNLSNVADGANIGLVTAVNKGTLRNLGITVSGRSQVSLLGAANIGLVAGVNEGLIEQDFEYATANKLATKILVYANDSLTVTPANKFSPVYVGGVTGLNKGSIVKVDKPELSLYGYSQYFVYANITINRLNDSGISNYEADITKSNAVGTIAGYSQSGSSIAGRGYRDDYGKANQYDDDNKLIDGPKPYTFGEGILVGGKVEGPQYVGGAVGYFEGSSLDGTGSNYISYINDEDGIRQEVHLEFNGITSRTFVVGYSFNTEFTVGAITGKLTNVYFNDELVPDFAVQAIDDGREGLYASMVIRYLTSRGDISISASDSTTFYNIVAFGSAPASEQARVFIESERVRRYLKRECRKLIEGQDLVVEMPGDTRSYYGDFVEVSNIGGSIIVSNQLQFKEDTSSWSVGVNSAAGFKSFVDAKGELANNVYYAYYFAAGSVAFSDKEEDVMDAQSLLDQYLNYITPDGALYPIVASNGLMFSSANPEILSFNQAGNITVRASGLARVDISSILNENDKLTIYIQVENYFNTDENMSIVYPDLADDSVPVDATVITLKGSNSVSLYVKPNYSLNFGELDEYGRYEISIDSLGVVQMVGGMTINLAPNTNVQPAVTLPGYGEVDEDGNLKEEYFTQREGTTAEPGEVADVNISVNAQTVSFSKKPNSKEGTYALSIRTRIVASVPTDSGFENYYCNVNMDIKRAVLSYTKGAETINAKEFDELTIATSKVGEDYIVINSPSIEDKPHYVIYKVNADLSLGELVQGTYAAIADASKESEGLFTVKFTPEKQSAYGKQEFLFNLSVNKDSYAYLHRHENDIYGRYRIYIYADSDPSKYVITEIYLVNMNISNVVVNNYSDVTALEESLDFATASDKAMPGKTGLLMLNITPEDSDFDYIEIVNTDKANEVGNGKASFNLAARFVQRQGDKIFDEKRIAGSIIENGIRLYQNDIVRLYSTLEEGTNKNLYELYRGLIYLNYVVPTSGVLDESVTEFSVNIYKDGKLVYEPTIVQLTNNLTYQAYVTLDNKTALNEQEQGVYATYNVARGLQYRLNLNYFGFSFDNISVTTSSPEKAAIVYENGSYYLNITSDPFDYSLSDTEGFPISIFVNAEQTVDEEVRVFTSVTKVRVLEYVLDYNWEAGDPMLDLIANMDQGVINIQVGNRQTLGVDIVDLIEFDPTQPTVVAEVEAFMKNLTDNGLWTVYTNLNDSNMSNGKAVTTRPGEYESMHVLRQNTTYNNLYFKSTGLSISPTVTHDYLNSYYVFSYNARYAIDKTRGCYVASSDEHDFRLYTEFRFNVFQSSSEESPIPIDNFNDLMDMQSGAYYRLIDNITLENENFEPIAAQIASLDGNGYTIYMNGVYETNETNIGLFSSIGENTVIRNLNIALSGDTVFSTTADSFNFGMLAGENSGNITNCYVYSDNTGFSTQSYFLSVECSALDSGSYVAGLVGTNSGNITNSRSSINISSSFNVAGLVGMNSGKIASSYFKNGILIGTTQSNHRLGGLVVTNNEDGKIITSYVSGATDNGYVFSNDTRHYLSATSPEGGFAYSNRGTISDCYSNIKIQGSSTMAGFVFENGGTIRNSFSLSVLIDNVISSAGFSMTNISDDTEGVFENSYYFTHVSSGSSDNIGNINTSLANVAFSGVSNLDVAQFADLEQYFGEYSYSDTLTNNAVWYLSDGNSSDIFSNAQFNSGRLELVAPNIVAFSRQELVDTIEDEETGDVSYVYSYTLDSEELGSIKNPHIIYDTAGMEREFVERASRSGFVFDHYRLINDINYGEFDGLSELYTVSLAGSLEGNGMEIAQYSMLSQRSLTNAGLFAQIGRNVTNIGSVMNLTLVPREVNFTNANCVGALAGTLTYGYIYNVDVQTEDEVVVTGKNFVSGLIGRAINSYVVKNVSSNLSAISTYLPVENPDEVSDPNTNSYSHTSNNLNDYSYAGAILGFAGGTGSVNRVTADNIRSVRGDRAGVAIGGIDTNVEANYIYVNLSNNLVMRSSKFAGFAIGEVKGSAKYINIVGTGAVQELVSLSPNVPTAFGGIAGVVNNGSISEAYMGQGFRLGTKPNTRERVSYVGGIAGQVVGDSRISEVVVAQNLEASSILGGAIGRAGGSLKLDQIAVKAARLYVYGTDMYNSYLGGVIGSLEDNNAVEMTNIYTNADLAVSTSVYGARITASVGAFVGSGNPYRMSYCYSTGSITATLEDLRGASEDLHTVEEVVGTGREGDTYNFAEKDNTGEAQVLYRKTINTGNFDHVYYYGTNSSAVESLSTYSRMIKYDAKKYRQNVTLIENIHGTGSIQYADSIKNTSSSTEKSVLNGIYSGYYLDTLAGAKGRANDYSSLRPCNKVYDFVHEAYDSSDKNSKYIDKFKPRGNTTYYYGLYDSSLLPRNANGTLIYNPTADPNNNYEKLYFEGKYVAYELQDLYVKDGNTWKKDGQAWLIDVSDYYIATSISARPRLLYAYDKSEFTGVETVYFGSDNSIYYAFGQISETDSRPAYFLRMVRNVDNAGNVSFNVAAKFDYDSISGVYKQQNNSSNILDLSQLRTGLWSINNAAAPTLAFESQMTWRR